MQKNRVVRVEKMILLFRIKILLDVKVTKRNLKKFMCLGKGKWSDGTKTKTTLHY